MPAESLFHGYHDAVPPMTVGTFPVTSACSVLQTSPLMTGYRGVLVQVVNAGGRGVFVIGICQEMKVIYNTIKRMDR